MYARTARGWWDEEVSAELCFEHRPQNLCAKLYEIIRKEFAITTSQFVRPNQCGNSNRGIFAGGEGGI